MGCIDLLRLPISFVLVIWSFTGIAAQNLTANKSVVDSNQNSAYRTLSNIQKDILQIKAKNDSLTRELFFYRQKEDLYIGIFERYSTRLEWAVGLILAILAIVAPFSGYFYIQKVRKRLKEISSIKKTLFAQSQTVNSGQADLFHNMSVALSYMGSSLGTAKTAQRIWLSSSMHWESLQCAHKAFLLYEKEDRNHVISIMVGSMALFRSTLQQVEVDELLREFMKSDTRIPVWLSHERPLLIDLMGYPSGEVQTEATETNLLILRYSKRYQELKDT